MMKLLLILLFIPFISFSYDYSSFIRRIDLKNPTKDELVNVLSRLNSQMENNNLKPYEKNIIAVKIKLVDFKLSRFDNSLEIERYQNIYWILSNCKKDEFELQSYCHFSLFFLYREVSYEISKTHIKEAIKFGTKTSFHDLVAFENRMLSTVFYQEKKYNEAIKYLKRIITNKSNLKFVDHVILSSVYNDISLNYRMLKQVQLQKKYLDTAFMELNRIKIKTKFVSDFKHVLLKNLGDYYIDKKDFSKAEEILKKELDYFHGINDYLGCFVALESLNNLFLNAKKNPPKYFETYAISIYDKLDLNDKLTIIEFLILYNKENSLKVNLYLEKNQDLLQEQWFQDFTKKKRYDLFFKHYEKQINIVNDQKKELLKKTFQSERLFLLIIIIFVFSVSSFLYFYFRNKSKNAVLKQRLSEESVLVQKLENEILKKEFEKQELENKELQVNLIIKNEAEKVFMDELKKIKKTKKYTPEEIISTMQIKINQLLEVDKRNFLNSNEKINTKFYLDKIKKLYPQLTNLEQKLVLYFFLKMSTKEISSLLEMTEGSVRVYKNRIRKKLGLDSSFSFSNLTF